MHGKLLQKFYLSSVDSKLSYCLGVWYAGMLLRKGRLCRGSLILPKKSLTAIPGCRCQILLSQKNQDHHRRPTAPPPPEWPNALWTRSYTIRLTNSFILLARTANKQTPPSHEPWSEQPSSLRPLAHRLYSDKTLCTTFKHFATCPLMCLLHYVPSSCFVYIPLACMYSPCLLFILAVLIFIFIPAPFVWNTQIFVVQCQ